MLPLDDLRKIKNSDYGSVELSLIFYYIIDFRTDFNLVMGET